MSDTERVIGMLQEFRAWVKEEFLELKQDSKETRRDILDLKQFKWQIIGGATVCSVLASGAITLVGFWIKRS